MQLCKNNLKWRVSAIENWNQRVSRGSGKNCIFSPLIASFPLVVCRPTICPENNEGNLLETKLLHFKLATEKKRSLISVQIALSPSTKILFFIILLELTSELNPIKKGEKKEVQKCFDLHHSRFLSGKPKYEYVIRCTFYFLWMEVFKIFIDAI